MKSAEPGARGALIAAEPEAVDRLCFELRSGLLAGLPPGERFIVELLVREALMNAVAHGSGVAGSGQEGPSQIHYEVLPVAGGIVIRVKDGGSGFDWRGWRAANYQPLAESGRGVHIFHRYADRVRFFENGSRVELVRMFPKGELRA